MTSLARPRQRTFSAGQAVLHAVFIILCACYVIPFMLVISISLSGGSAIASKGFSLIPLEFTWSTYAQIFRRPEQILTAYRVTLIFTAATVAGSLVLQSMIAYSLSRPDFRLRRGITFLLFFTTLFGGGMVPSYILNTQYLRMGNTLWIYIVPGLVSVWNVIILRTNFQTLPGELVEAATIDGASELRICFTIVIPLSTPALASIGFLTFIAKWNDWFTTQLYIKSMDLYSLQYFLKKLLTEAEYAKQFVESGILSESDALSTISTEAYRFAMAVVAAGPMVFVFPFFQKYFAKGLTLGSVKG